MVVWKAIYCRAVQGGFRMALPLLPYREPELLASCQELEDVMSREMCRSVLIVTDRGVVQNGLVRPLQEVLERCGVRYAIYDNTQPNPTVDNVEQALTLYHREGCQMLIAIGGGSPMDCAKAVGARVAYPRRPVGRMKGVLRVLRSLPPLVAIPTTAGTGSETTLAAIITDSQSHYKYALMSFPLIPRYAVLDAELTRSLPPHLTAATGMDALTHAVEAYIGRSTTRETRQMALEAVELVFAHLERAFRDGDDRQARAQMLQASYKAGLAFTKSYVGYVHAMAHALGGQYGTPHGLANAVILPHVLEAYGPVAHRKLYRLGVAAGVCRPSDSIREGAGRLVQAIRALNGRLGIPERLAGIAADDIPLLARRAEREANPLYPVPRLMTAAELEGLYHQISDGRRET